MNFESIVKPTLLLNPEIARRNIHRMAEKARLSGVTLRPHFKTHQSAQIGEWFRQEGVNVITVSSVEMAVYFAAHGWTDILIAFGANRRELEAIDHLAGRVHIGLLFEEADTLTYFQEHLHTRVDVWLEADNGAHRTGIPLTDQAAFIALAQTVKAPFTLKGILTHAGNAYHAASLEEIKQIYTDTLNGLSVLKQKMAEAGFAVALSYGDTPTLSQVDLISGLDEIRPGNFIFFDSTQLSLGSCRAEDIAVGVACPVIAVYPERGQLALYGGGVHLSKDHYELNGKPCFGLVCFPTPNGWSEPIPGATVRSLWQEHAQVDMDLERIKSIHPGDLLIVLPSHSCMTVDLFDAYLTPQGEQVLIKA